MTVFLHFLFKKKKLGEGTSIRRSKVTLPLSRTCSVDFFMLIPHNKPAFLALIPPSFTSLNPFVTFFRLLQPPSSSPNWGKYDNSRFKSDVFSSFRLHVENAVTRNKPCTRSLVPSAWVKKFSIRSWVELHFTSISYILSFNYSYRYEINLIRIMYTANSSILYSKEKTIRILGTWYQYLVNVSGLRYCKQIKFQEELITFLRTWLLYVSSP